MSKIEPLPDSEQSQAHPIGARSEFARRVDEAHDLLARMETQEEIIRNSIRDSRKAIQESRILLMEPDQVPV